MVDHQVVVVGAGPVGLSLAIELGWRGIDVLVVERGDGSVTFPAGESIFSRTMEHFRRWGVAAQARSEAIPPSDYPHRVVFMTAAGGHLLCSFDNGATNSQPGSFAPFTPEGPAFLSKFFLMPFLQRVASSLPSVRLAFERTVTGVVQDGDGVTVEVSDPRGGRTRVGAQYLAACDGGRSSIREWMGVSLAGEFAQGHNFAVHFDAPELLDLVREHAGGPVAQIQTLATPRRPYITVVDGRSEWRLSVYTDGEPTAEDAVRLVREAVGRDIEIRILRAQAWSGHQVVADRYRAGRVFLVGDAGHLLWPKGGFGANTGVGDAVDLGWKLAGVLDGWAGPNLLDSYEAERRPIAARNVAEAAGNWSVDAQIVPNPLLTRDGVEGDDARKEIAALIEQVRSREFLSIGVQLGYRYRDSPIIVADDTAEPPDSPGRYTPSTWPGARAPHAWLSDGTSLLDHFGRGFVLVDTGRSDEVEARDRLVQAAAQAGVPFQVVPARDEALGPHYPTRYTLVRPDGHVCWRGDSIPAQPERIIDVVSGQRVHTPA